MDGIGIYLRALNKCGTPKQAAKRAADYDVSFVAFMGAWQEPLGGKLKLTGPKLDEVKRYGEAFEQAGIDTWVWGYPWGGGEAAFHEMMISVGNQLPSCAGYILDPELGYKWKGKSKTSLSMRGQPEAIAGSAVGTEAERKQQATELVTLFGNETLCVTSYGMAKYHPNFPWKEFVAPDGVIGSPQLYEVTAAQVEVGLSQWIDLGSKAHLVPSVPAFGSKSGAALHEHLSNFVTAGPAIDGFIVWSWPQISDRKGSAGKDTSEWDVLARWAEWLNRGACAL